MLWNNRIFIDPGNDSVFESASNNKYHRLSVVMAFLPNMIELSQLNSTQQKLKKVLVKHPQT